MITRSMSRKRAMDEAIDSNYDGDSEETFSIDFKIRKDVLAKTAVDIVKTRRGWRLMCCQDNEDISDAIDNMHDVFARTASSFLSMLDHRYIAEEAYDSDEAQSIGSGYDDEEEIIQIKRDAYKKLYREKNTLNRATKIEEIRESLDQDLYNTKNELRRREGLEWQDECAACGTKMQDEQQKFDFETFKALHN